MSFGDMCLNAIFRDEKNVIWAALMGLHDLRKESSIMFSRQHGGGSPMVWGAIYFKVQTSQASLRGLQKSKNYKEILVEYLLPFGEVLGGIYWTF
ncbi:hypothetical protein AVEN_191127-1 [Araneus ventricosus]|uniref:Uncharacterized protein n=1 Tax=Araneus ventricosus TaxID=182803 RepID=A0A4Y2B012_ARAVE|nr:hypothetical protein AVEN_191127-1 [Araneus ventricosus]